MRSLALVFTIVLFTAGIAQADLAERNPRPRPTPIAQAVACPALHWHLVSGPSPESCRGAGECAMSCPSLGASCVDLNTSDFCETGRFGKEYLCFCPN